MFGVKVNVGNKAGPVFESQVFSIDTKIISGKLETKFLVFTNKFEWVDMTDCTPLDVKENIQKEAKETKEKMKVHPLDKKKKR